MSIFFYRAATFLATPAVPQFLKRRLRQGKEDADRLSERFGLYTLERPSGSVIWLHAASVGEANSSFILIKRLRSAFPQATLLLTTGTVTSAALVAARRPEGVIHQYCPVDSPIYVRRFLDHWKPDAALWIESELWPNLVSQTHARGIPMALVNARISQRSQRRWARAASIFRSLISYFEIVLCQSGEDVNAFRTLGVEDAASVGNLKFSAEPAAFDPDAHGRLQEAFGNRPRWVAASTHPGEEELVTRVHRQLKDRYEGLLTIVVPRHPHRGEEVAAIVASMDVPHVRRSARSDLPPECEIYIADTLGELGLFYANAPIAYVGGGMAHHGGHNPIEPAQLNCAILYGPDRSNFTEVANQLEKAGAAAIVRDEAEWVSELSGLLGDPDDAKLRAERAFAVADQNQGIVDRVFDRLAPLLEKRVGPS